ncbi:hypothetical protein JTE90_016812 [Oedothorax gibbosus]|uniref:Secreted protein n=1 Tax=Oedothorax gibbosus TaxID=931172 RepID=A0AAV6VZ52_9ARAC|nr:hypothetical protein JTE90_016812 [Oedothorax gibbosus]
MAAKFRLRKLRLASLYLLTHRLCSPSMTLEWIYLDVHPIWSFRYFLEVTATLGSTTNAATTVTSEAHNS